MTKTIPKKQKCNKTKWLSEEALQVVEKRKEVKGKGERESYVQLRQCQRMLKLPTAALISHSSNAQNSPSQASAIREP